MTQEETKIDKVTTETIADQLVAPHIKQSKEVIEADIERIVEEGQILYQLCFAPVGMYMGAFAIHDTQINDKDPLNFFVTVDKKIVINPVITRHSNYLKDSKEGSISFPELPQRKDVKRWQKCEVEYVTIMTDPEDNTKFKLSSKIQESLSGSESFLFQHMIDLGVPKYIYSVPATLTV